MTWGLGGLGHGNRKLGRVIGILIIAAGGVAGCTTARPDAKTSGGSSMKAAFSFATGQPAVLLVLRPDPIAQRVFPDAPFPKKPITISLPVYPGAEVISPVSGIRDNGALLTWNALDGSVYFQSSHSAADITAWYSDELLKYHYTRSGMPGDIGPVREPTNGLVEFIYDRRQNYAKSPVLDLGFTRRGNETMFKWFGAYVVTPPRPPDSFLPSDITKVELTQGSKSRFITDKTWISRVVSIINKLPMNTGGISTGSAESTIPAPIQAKFYRRDGSFVTVTFSGVDSLIPWAVTVGSSGVALPGAKALDQVVDSKMGA